QPDRRPRMVGQDEHRGVERGLVPPPALPRVVLPGPALGPELVAPHDLRADVVREVTGEVVVDAPGPAGLGAVRPARGRAGPGEEPTGVHMAEGTLQALVLARADPVARDVEVLHSQQLR